MIPFKCKDRIEKIARKEIKKKFYPGLRLKEIKNVSSVIAINVYNEICELKKD